MRAHAGALLRRQRNANNATGRMVWLSERPRDTLFVAVSDFVFRAFDIRVRDKHGIATEDGVFLTTEDGRTLIDEPAPRNPI